MLPEAARQLHILVIALESSIEGLGLGPQLQKGCSPIDGGRGRYAKDLYGIRGR
jgi:hypothetical protein